MSPACPARRDVRPWRARRPSWSRPGRSVVARHDLVSARPERTFWLSPGSAARVRLTSDRRPGPTATGPVVGVRRRGAAVQQARISVPSAPPARIEPAQSQAARDPAPEVAARRARRGGAPTDPAAGRLRLRSGAMRATPDRHGPDRSCARPAVEANLRGSNAYSTMVSTWRSVTLPPLRVVTSTVARPLARRRTGRDRGGERRDALAVRPELARDDGLEARDRDREQRPSHRPARRPSGSVTTTVRLIWRGSFDALNR